MPDSIPERITEIIVTRLQEIRTANEYNQSVEVERFKGKTVIPRNNLVLVESSADVPAGDDDGPVVFPGNPPAVQKRRTFSMHGFKVIGEKEPDELDKLLDQLGFDIQKAIAVDATDYWGRFGGLSVFADFGEMSRVMIEGFPAIHVPLDVTYRHSENDPYTVR